MGKYRTFWTTPEHAQVMKPNLSWSYRIQGVAEAPADPTLHTFGVPLATATSCYIHLFGQRVRNISEESHRNTEVCTFCVHSDILCIILCTFCVIIIVHLTYRVVSNLLQNLSRTWLVWGSLASCDAGIKACYLVYCCCTLAKVQARESLQTTYALTLIGLDTTPGDRPTGFHNKYVGMASSEPFETTFANFNSHHCTTGMATNCPVNWKYHRSIKRWQLCSKSCRHFSTAFELHCWMFPGFPGTCISLTA